MTHRGTVNRRTGKTTPRATKKTHWGGKGHGKSRAGAARPSAPK